MPKALHPRLLWGGGGGGAVGPQALTGAHAVLLIARRGRRRVSHVLDGLEQELAQRRRALGGSAGQSPQKGRLGRDSPPGGHPPGLKHTLYSFKKPALPLAALLAQACAKFITEMGWDLGEGWTVDKAHGVPQLPLLVFSALPMDRIEGPSRILFRRQLCRKMYWLWQEKEDWVS